MKRCSRRPLAAAVFVFSMSPIAIGQVAEDETFPCDAACQETCLLEECDNAELARLEACRFPSLNETYDLCNRDLRNVRGHVPTVFALDAAGACVVVRTGTPGKRLCRPNLGPASVLSQLDIDGDGVPDNAPDTDGDGLPDNWETGGVEALTATGTSVDRVVFYPAPSAIVPGTPPTPIFTRLAVATDALKPDTDDDGLTDFVEVFGLVFIDEPAPQRDGLLGTEEWLDLNGDGLPSPGEHPIEWVIPDAAVIHDFDGFVFTDPTNPDTDGDSKLDGVDNDPLINPRAFGNVGIIVRLNAQGNEDIDQDGIGNGMDMGNDLTSADGPGVQDFEVIDNPESTIELLELFRQDLLQENPPIVPESGIEELLGVDWDGNGLWRTTDVRNWSVIIGDPTGLNGTSSVYIPPNDLFDVGGHKLYAPQSFEELQAIVNAASYRVYAGTVRGVEAASGGRQRIGMGWQALLRPSGTTNFIPDPRVWSILYAWRMPGFDIDGDGFVGVPNISDTFGIDGSVPQLPALVFNPNTQRFELEGDNPVDPEARPFDDRIEIGNPEDGTDEVKLDGVIQPPPAFPLCGTGFFSFGIILVAVLGLARRGARLRG